MEWVVRSDDGDDDDDDDDDVLGSPWFDTLLKDRLAKRTTSFIAVIRGKAADYVMFYL